MKRSLASAARWRQRRWPWRDAARMGSWFADLESVVLPLLILGLGWKLRPQDALGIHAGFPWAWLGPWLVAVRYGAGRGLFGAALYAAFWELSMRLGLAPAAAIFPSEYFLGGVLMTLVLGEFGTAIVNRQDLHREVARDLRARLERTKRRLFLVKEALDTLEQELTDRPLTLRDAMLEMRRSFAFATPGVGAAHAGGPPLPDPNAFMLLLSQACRLLEAGVFVRRRQGRAWRWEQAFSLGQDLPLLDAGHPLIERCLQSGEAVHVAQERAAEAERSQWVFAAPLRLDEQGRPDALLAVHSMPFMSFEQQNLQRLQVLCASYLDFAHLEAGVAPIREAWPQAPVGLQQEWAQLSGLGLRTRLRSYCAVWMHEGPLDAEEFSEFSSRQPVESSMWTFETASGAALVVLLPLISASAVAHYRGEMQEVLEQIRERSGHPEPAPAPAHLLLVQGPPGMLELRALIDSAGPPPSDVESWR